MPIMKNIIISFTVVILLILAFVGYETIRSQQLIQQTVDPQSAVILGRHDAEESFNQRSIHLHSFTNEFGELDYPGVRADEREWFFEEYPTNTRFGFCRFVGNELESLSLNLEQYKNTIHYALAYNVRMMELLYEERETAVTTHLGEH